MCQALGVPPDRKYQNEGGPAPSRSSACCATRCPRGEPRDAVEQFVDALV